MRYGARAASVLILGALGIVLGAEAVYFWGAVGLSGDDYTGLLSIIAAAALLGVGTGILWTSRKLDDSRWWRYPRRSVIALAGLLGFVWLVAPLGFSYGVTHITRAEVPAENLSTGYEDVKLRTADGLDLAGCIPSRNGAAVIVYPGRGKSQKHARFLSRRGYGVLLIDRRGEGASDGDPHGFGWTFDEDIRAGVALLQRRADVEPGRIGGGSGSPSVAR